MRTAMRAMRWICAAVVLAPLAFAGSEPCVPEGGSIDVNFPNPDISGFGAGAHLEPTANVNESDPGPDDSIGTADCSGGSVTVSVGNDGENLTAGSEVGDGETGADCFEIYVEWTVVYYVTETYTTDFALGPFGFGKSSTTIVKKRSTVRSEIKDVCPC